ncbi:hypothetical protein ANO11243_025490 [Dothideomycetidae sp. 11243]|nr:hypothetical protein ANO11243_025490 [fungal sp. No.11243]
MAGSDSGIPTQPASYTIPTIGLLTRTLSDSPVTRWILPLSVTDSLLFIGENHVHRYDCDVFTGHVNYKEALPRFTSKIMAAAVLRGDSGANESTQQSDLADFVILTFDDGSLRVVRFLMTSSGLVAEPHGTRAMPRSLDPLQTIGTLLAVGPGSTSIAVAARERGLLILDSKFNSADASLGLEVGGPVQDHSHVIHMAFLQVSSDTIGACHLLLVKVVSKKLLLQTLDWSSKEGSSRARMLPPQRINLGKSFPTSCRGFGLTFRSDGALPDLLIPLGDRAAFILAASTGLFLFENLLSGHAEQTKIALPKMILQADLRPSRIWVSYVRRPQSDAVMLFGDDGLVVLLDHLGTATSDTWSVVAYARGISPLPDTHAVHCFTTDITAHDVVILRGSTGEGGVYMVFQKHEPDTQYGTLIFDRIQDLPSWAVSLDMLCSNLPNSADHMQHESDRCFVTSGAHHDSQVAELRSGIAAPVLFTFDLGSDQPPSRIFTTPFADEGKSMALLLSELDTSTALGTRAIRFDSDGVTILDASSGPEGSDGQIQQRGVDLDSSTIHVSPDHKSGAIIQITRKAVYRVFDLDLPVETLYSISDGEVEIIAADVLEQDTDTISAAFVTSDNSSDSPKNVTLHWISLKSHGQGADAGTTAESVYVTSSEQGFSEQRREIRLLCSLRNGTVEVLGLHGHSGDHEHKEQSNQDLLIPTDGLRIEHLETIRLGVTTVMMTPIKTHSGDCFLASCGPGLYVITPSSSSSSSDVQPLYITDRDDTSFKHKNISAVCQVRHDMETGGVNLNGCLVVLMGSDCFIAEIQPKTELAIPRSICATGTAASSFPIRLMYSEKLAHFIVATVETRHHPGSDQQYNRSVLEYRPSSTNNDAVQDKAVTRALFQTGERIYALSEWSYCNDEGKQYLFTLVATGLDTVSQDYKQKSSRGRIHLLQPRIKHGRIVDVTFRHSLKFDEPVYALAMYSPVAFICGHGQTLSAYQYWTSDKKWRLFSSYRLNSPAISISVKGGFVNVTTASDSLLTFAIMIPDSRVHAFVLISCDSRPANGLHHIDTMGFNAIDLEGSQEVYVSVTVLSTRTAEVRGLSTIMDPANTQFTNAVNLFSARLPYSLTRLQRFNATESRGRIETLVGLATNGALYGLGLLKAHDWARLKYMEVLVKRRYDSQAHQNLISELSRIPLGFSGLEPMTNESNAAFEARTGYDLAAINHTMETHRNRRISSVDSDGDETMHSGDLDTDNMSPIQYCEAHGSSFPRGERIKPEDMHVNGDVLGWLMTAPYRRDDEDGIGNITPEKRLETMLRAEARGSDRIGVFVREHLQEELQLVPEVLQLVRRSLKAWGYW